MPAPLEVFAAGTGIIYLAPTGTAEPAVNVAVPGTYIQLGLAGAQDYSEDGIVIDKQTDENKVYTSGQYGVRKIFRTREDLSVKVTVFDMTLEALSAAFNQTTVATLAGPPAIKRMALLENTATPTFRTMLIRVPTLSPYMDGGVTQVWVPLVYQVGNTAIALKKADPVGIEFEFGAIADATNGFGFITEQTA